MATSFFFVATRKVAMRRESSRFWYGGLTGDEITPDRGRSGPGRLRDPCTGTRWITAGKQSADRLEETYQERHSVRSWDELLGC
jgi:hypothetical protein